MAEDLPLAYTSNPVLLFVNDVYLFFLMCFSFPGLLGIVWPLRPCPSGKLDELASSWRNALSLLIHTILVFAQLLIIILAAISPFLLFVPAPVYFGGLIITVVLNWLLCGLLFHGIPGQKFYAGRKYARNPDEPGEQWVSKEHPQERWLFINGVGVGTHWMNSNLVRLSLTFRRPVLGIYNPTYGIIFDVLETIIQRSFGYPTLDIRRAYKTVSTLLREEEVGKVVLIAHSQGSVEAGMVLDWLYGTLPRKQVAKLEVYTFGNVANHWNNPKDEEGKPAIRYVEHYVNQYDWVARFGVMHFRGMGRSREPIFLQKAIHSLGSATTGEKAPEPTREKRFVGTVFIRDASGHLFNQHYLNNLFPMTQGADGQSAVDEGADYMNKEADASILSVKDAIVPQEDAVEVKAVTDPSQIFESPPLTESTFVVKTKSRLWQYRNGKSITSEAFKQSEPAKADADLYRGQYQ